MRRSQTTQTQTQNQNKKSAYPERQYKKWLTSEVLKTMREYDLLEMPIKDIAVTHKRSEAAIVAILKEEGLIV
jgi:hypothetical protein